MLMLALPRTGHTQRAITQGCCCWCECNNAHTASAMSTTAPYVMLVYRRIHVGQRSMHVYLLLNDKGVLFNCRASVQASLTASMGCPALHQAWSRWAAST